MTRDKATQIEVLAGEIEEIEANIASVDARLARLPDGEAREQYEADKSDFLRELEERRAELEVLRAS
jgi:hypothetical protein